MLVRRVLGLVMVLGLQFLERQPLKLISAVATALPLRERGLISTQLIRNVVGVFGEPASEYRILAN
jgi:hypothetical protein